MMNVACFTFPDASVGIRTKKEYQKNHSSAVAKKESISNTFPESTDLSLLKNKRVLLIVDDDNLRISCEREGFRFSYAMAMEKIGRAARQLIAWSFITPVQGDRRRTEYLQERGINVFHTYRETVTTAKGVEVKANADNDLIFETAMLVQKGDYDMVCIGTGDADLGLTIVKGIKRHYPKLETVTLSVQSTTGRRLHQDQTQWVKANIFIGQDLLHSMRDRRSYHSLPKKRTSLLQRMLEEKDNSDRFKEKG